MIVLLLILSVVFFRVAAGTAGDETLTMVANFSPLMALALCGGALLPKRGWALAIPLAAVIGSDVAINAIRGLPQFSIFSIAVYSCVVGVAVIGWAIRSRLSFPRLLCASVAGSLLFYLVTNTLSFFFFPGYPMSFAGWVQCLTVGLPGYPPTLVFLAKSLAGDLLFTSLAAFACGLVWKPLPLRQPTAA